MSNEFIMKPKVDFCFKELMEDKDVRKGFLSVILGVKAEEILKTELLPTHLRKEQKEDKFGILDVRVLLNGNIEIDIEIQLMSYRLWPERSLFYLSKMYTNQIHEGEAYDKLGKCIHIGILNFELFPEEKEYYSCFHFWEDDRHIKYTDKIELHILELTKLEKYEYPETELLKWMKFMNAEKMEDFEMLAKDNEYMEKAYERLARISADKEKRLEYEAREKAIRDHNSFMKYYAEKGFQQGMEQGIEQGICHFVEFCQELHIPIELAKKNLSEKFKLEIKAVDVYFEKYWKRI